MLVMSVLDLHVRKMGNVYLVKIHPATLKICVFQFNYKKKSFKNDRILYYNFGKVLTVFC